MKSIENIFLQNIDKPNSCFIFPTDTAASRWADHLLRLRSGSIAMKKFIAWDIFKQNSIKSKVQNKKSIPAALRKIYISRLIKENADTCKQGKTPVFSSLIRTEWAEQASQFAPWITRLLPQLGSWFNKTTGLAIESVLGKEAQLAAEKLEGDDKDMFVLAQRYSQFLEERSLFEPAWETPPFNNDGMDYFLFFPESLSDYSEYRELLAASSHVKTISAENTETLPCDTFYYTNSRSEITEAALYIRALHEKQGINWDEVAVCIADQENYEPYLLREFTNRNIPFVKRSSKPLTDYPAGQFFRAVTDCASRNFAFSALASLVLNRNLPWKDTAQIHNLIEFGIENNCISSWVEEKDGKENTVNVWEDAFETPFGKISSDSRRFFTDLKRRLISFRTAASFFELRKQYFIFREHFFDMTQCSEETDLILSRCISELMYLCEIEKDYPDVPAVDPFMFLTEYLNEVNYLAQTKTAGVNILPYKTAAAAPFDCHIVLGAGQENLSVVFSKLDFLTRKKREKLGIFDEDASTAFINMHKYNSVKTSAFFCSEQTFSGFTIPHSKIGAPSEPKERFAEEDNSLLQEKFSQDYYRAENFLLPRTTDNISLKKLHKNQIHGFEKWKTRRQQIPNVDKKTNSNKALMELIQKKYAKNPNFTGKYSVSASSLKTYKECSVKWIFERVLSLENVQIEANLMAENISGIVYHAVLNLFFSELKETNEPLLKPLFSTNVPYLPETYSKLLQRSANTVFDSFPSLQAGGRSEMSALTARLLRAGKRQLLFNLENCLARFLSLFAGHRVMGCEKSFQAERGTYFFNGILDCILEVPSQTSEYKYIIADFKLKWMPKRGNCTGDGENGLSDFQLPMYITLAEENENLSIETALFYSILDLVPEVIIGAVQDINTNAIIPKNDKQISRNSEKCRQIFKDFLSNAEQFAEEISTGNFSVHKTKYNDCSECQFNRICRTVYIINREKTVSLGGY